MWPYMQVPSSATESADIEKLFDAEDLSLQTSAADSGQNKRKLDDPPPASAEPKVCACDSHCDLTVHLPVMRHCLPKR